MINFLGTAKRIFTVLIMIIAVGMMIFTVVSVSTFNRNDRKLFGYKAFVVLSDSMKATDFAAGDVVLIKSVDPATLQEGDIISYSSESPDNFGEIITHKIRKKAVTKDGEPGFVTYGTTTDTDDEIIVTYPHVCGKYQFSIPKLGAFFTFLRTTPGYIICILIPFIILITMQEFNAVKLFRQYKREQLEEVESEQAKLEEERRQSKAMMEELEALKAQMAKQNALQNESESN